MQPNLYAVMPVYNEADRSLEDVLKHLKTIVDYIFVWDDRSTDESVDIARKYADHVAIRPEGTPGFRDHEGYFRQAAWNEFQTQFVPNAGVDWVLANDADEKLWTLRKSPTLNQLLSQPDYDVINVEFYHMWNEYEYRVDKAWKPHGSTRLFKFFYAGKYQDKKMACGAEPRYVNDLVRRGRYLRDSPLAMQHLGYVKDEDKPMKYERYSTLDGGAFHSNAHIQSIMDDKPELVKWVRGE